MVDMGEHQMTIFCKGQGVPTIILGNEVTQEPSMWTDGSLNDLKGISRTCRYARIEKAGEALADKHTTEDQVQELHELLTKLGVPGPYVLVGHELSGLNVLLYTDHYPIEVVGLVCVDCFSSILVTNMMDEFGVEQPDESDEIKAVRYYWSFDDWTTNAGNLLFRTSFAQARKVTSLGDRPFVVLTSSDFPEGWSSIGFDKIWFDSAIELSKLSSRIRMEIVSNTRLWTIPYSDAVTKAIQEVVDLARQTP